MGWYGWHGMDGQHEAHVNRCVCVAAPTLRARRFNNTTLGGANIVRQAPASTPVAQWTKPFGTTWQNNSVARTVGGDIPCVSDTTPLIREPMARSQVLSAGKQVLANRRRIRHARAAAATC